MFFQSRNGRQITGSEEASFASNFKSLPDNTQANAMIKSFKVNQYDGEIYFQIIWSIVDGEFAGALVKQRITPFDADNNKADRQLNMLYRIFKLCGQRTDYVDQPTDYDLAEMIGKILAIKIGNGIIQGEERTWVREVWREGDLEVLSAPKQVVKRDSPGSALTRNADRKRSEMNSQDLPF